MEAMAAKETLNLIDRLRARGFDNDKVVECIEYTGKREMAFGVLHFGGN